jgi:uncharacterized membrane protein
MPAGKSWTDQKIENVVGNLLRAGVFLSAIVVLHGSSRPDYHIFHGEPADLRSLSGILHEAVALRGRGIIQLGLLLLIATPIARVAFSVFGFAEERDHMYVSFTLIVLAILLYSLVGSAGVF